MIEFQAEDWFAVRAEVLRWIPLHYREAYGGDVDFDPNVPEYDLMARVGMLLVTTARRDGELVGYVLAFVRPHPHQRGVLWGTIDSYFLRHSARGPRVAMRMMKAAERFLAARGAHVLYGAEKDGGGLFRLCGWRDAHERVWKRDLRWQTQRAPS